MKTLTIFYDPHCGLCTTFRLWLERQKKSVRVEFIGYSTPEAEQRMPIIRQLHADQDIVVLADDGRWWQGSAAWIVCLWTTFEYRDWSFRLAAPQWQPLVKRVVHALSTRRHRLSQLMGLKSEGRLWTAVSQLPDETCVDGRCQLPAITPPALPKLAQAKKLTPTHTLPS